MNRMARFGVLSLVAVGLPLAAVGRARAQTACPLALTDGQVGREEIKLSFRNRGKVPVEQFSLLCSASAKGRGRVCHTETGVFYPGTQYWITFAYPDPDLRPVTIALNTAQMSGGAMWTSRSADACRRIRLTARH